MLIRRGAALPHVIFGYARRVTEKETKVKESSNVVTQMETTLAQRATNQPAAKALK